MAAAEEDAAQALRRAAQQAAEIDAAKLRAAQAERAAADEGARAERAAADLAAARCALQGVWRQHGGHAGLFTSCCASMQQRKPSALLIE